MRPSPWSVCSHRRWPLERSKAEITNEIEPDWRNSWPPIGRSSGVRWLRSLWSPGAAWTPTSGGCGALVSGPYPTWDVTKIRSPHTIGDDAPRPRIVAFHATFSLGPQRSGRLRSRDTPVPSGPRHCGQLSARRLTIEAAPTRSAIVTVRRLRIASPRSWSTLPDFRAGRTGRPDGKWLGADG